MHSTSYLWKIKRHMCTNFTSKVHLISMSNKIFWIYYIITEWYLEICSEVAPRRGDFNIHSCNPGHLLLCGISPSKSVVGLSHTKHFINGHLFVFLKSVSMEWHFTLSFLLKKKKTKPLTAWIDTLRQKNLKECWRENDFDCHYRTLVKQQHF